MKELFLDANAHLPMSQGVIDFYCKFNDSVAGHGHPLSPSKLGRAAASAIEEARGKIAKLIGAQKSSQIIFTSGCTSACEWGLLLLVELTGFIDDIWLSQIEHPAVYTAAEDIFGKQIQKIPVNSDGQVSYKRQDNIICIHMQNEIGTIQDIGKFNKKYLFSDMSQSLGKISVNVSDLDVDIAVFGAHKFGGPSGVGWIYLKNTDCWKEYGTGSRYVMDTPGTPNVGGIAATAVALEHAINTLDERRDNMISFRDVIEPELSNMGFEIIGEKADRCPNTTFAKTPKTGDAFRILNLLGNSGVHIGLGSACGSLYTGGSPLMQALNRPSDGQDYIRVSQWGEYNKLDAECFINQLRKMV